MNTTGTAPNGENANVKFQAPARLVPSSTGIGK
jgi:hypothetical protein